MRAIFVLQKNHQLVTQSNNFAAAPIKMFFTKNISLSLKAQDFIIVSAARKWQLTILFFRYP